MLRDRECVQRPWRWYTSQVLATATTAIMMVIVTRALPIFVRHELLVTTKVTPIRVMVATTETWTASHAETIGATLMAATTDATTDAAEIEGPSPHHPRTRPSHASPRHDAGAAPPLPLSTPMTASTSTPSTTMAGHDRFGTVAGLTTTTTTTTTTKTITLALTTLAAITTTTATRMRILMTMTVVAGAGVGTYHQTTRLRCARTRPNVAARRMRAASSWQLRALPFRSCCAWASTRSLGATAL
jgi:hypothetical protein